MTNKKVEPGIRLTAITDFLTVRMGEYGRLIVGLSVSFPVEVLKAAENLHPLHFLDETAREYLLILRDHRQELEASSEPTAISIRLVEQSKDYFRLIGWAATAARVVRFDQLERLCRDLLRMVNTYNVIVQMQNEIPPDGNVTNFRERILAAIMEGEDEFTTGKSD